MQSKTSGAPHLSLQSWIAFAVAVILTFAVFAYFHALAYGRPALFSAIAIGLAAKVRWELHGYAWFWFIIGSDVALHLLAICLIPWNNRWVPAALIGPVVVVDALVLLAVIQAVEKRRIGVDANNQVIENDVQ